LFLIEHAARLVAQDGFLRQSAAGGFASAHRPAARFDCVWPVHRLGRRNGAFGRSHTPGGAAIAEAAGNDAGLCAVLKPGPQKTSQERLSEAEIGRGE